MFKKRYRIITHNYSGWTYYSPQVRYWWFPFFWVVLGDTYLFSSIEIAKQVIRDHNRVVWRDTDDE